MLHNKSPHLWHLKHKCIITQCLGVRCAGTDELAVTRLKSTCQPAAISSEAQLPLASALSCGWDSAGLGAHILAGGQPGLALRSQQPCSHQPPNSAQPAEESLSCLPLQALISCNRGGDWTVPLSDITHVIQAAPRPPHSHSRAGKLFGPFRIPSTTEDKASAGGLAWDTLNPTEPSPRRGTLPQGGVHSPTF